MADLMDEAIEISHKLIPCNICGRTFLPSPLKKHAKVCEKNATRKRKTFNSLKQRIEGTELAAFHQKSFLRKSENICTSVPVVAAAPHVSATVGATATTAVNEEKRNQSKWKEKHEELVQAIRAAKGEKVMAPRRSISAVGSMGTTEQCPSCDRHFGPKAYDRHVEWCKEHKIRASKSPAIVTIAKERLEARTKYRVPPLNKSKRSVTREKYAPPSGRNQDTVMNVRSTSSLEQTSVTRKSKQKNNPAQNCPPLLAEPIIKHNSEKLKSSNFKYRVYPIQKMNDTDINDSVLDMTVSQVNLCSPSRRPSPPLSSPIKLITWKDTQQQNEQILTAANVSKNTCLPFTVNLVDSEQKNPNNNSDSNTIDIEKHENNACDTNTSTLGTIPEEPSDSSHSNNTNCSNVNLPTIEEEAEPPELEFELVTIKEAVPICDDTDDEQMAKTIEIVEINQEAEEAPGIVYQEAYSLESLEEFRSSTPFNQTDADSIQIRNETEHSISFDISPILRAEFCETPLERKPSFTEVQSPKTKTEECFVEEQEWRESDEYYEPNDQNDEYSENSEEESQTEQSEDCKKTFNDYKDERRNAKRKDARMLDKFLKEKKHRNCRLEVEIIANESQAKRGKTNFNLYRVNSSEIVIRGDRCIDALNKSFSRNKIKHVNIVFVNEDTKDESEIRLQSDLNAKKYRDTFVINTKIPRMTKKLTGSKERARKRDNFWAQYTKNNCDDYEDNSATENDDSSSCSSSSEHNLTLPPINIKKKSKCEYPQPQRFSNSPTRFPPIYEDKHQSLGSKKDESKKHPLSPLKRSVSLSNPVVKARSMKNKQDIQDYLHVREQKQSREKLKALSPRSSDELFPVGHDMYNEYKKYEDMYRREQDELSSSNSNEEQEPDNSPPPPPPPPERNYTNQHPKHPKMNPVDSAYGSLNRKSPKVHQVGQNSRQAKAHHVKRSPSSSGSETCTSIPAKKNNRLTKFCHECGTKYPLDSAKFCVECGIKRLVL